MDTQTNSLHYGYANLNVLDQRTYSLLDKALFVAIKQDDAAVVDVLLNAGANIEAREETVSDWLVGKRYFCHEF